MSGIFGGFGFRNLIKKSWVFIGAGSEYLRDESDSYIRPVIHNPSFFHSP